MALSGNKGEWSELYTFIKLLADGKIYCGDGKLNRYDDRFYPILEAFRDDSPNRNSYKINHGSILVAGESISIEVPQQEFMSQAKNILDFIQKLKGTSENESAEVFMQKIGCASLKAKSSDKADIRLVIHNLATGSKPELGYSIKSRIGGDSTLINASGDSTNFIYKLSNIDSRTADEANAIDSTMDMCEFLVGRNINFDFTGVASETLHNNLTILDLGIERIIAESILKYYQRKAKTLDEAVALVSREDPLHIKGTSSQPMYEYKVKQFLLAFALGMTPGTPWNTQFNANGGYIVVKEDGDLVCYHFFDRNDLEDYLYFNTRFESPSRSRHKYGKIYQENGAFFLKLNMQVRFR